MQHHIIAANIDQAIIFATLREPRTSQVIDSSCNLQAYHVPAIIVFNKSDLYRTKELEKFADKKQMYEHIGYRVVLMSLKEGTGLEELKAMLKNAVTLISGHSGVVSQFINILFQSWLSKPRK
jgi:ribosome biogenesis GTPase